MKTLPPIIIHYVCPNKDGMHGDGEYIAYVLVTGHVIIRRLKEGKDELEYSYFIRKDSEGFILMDDPCEEWLTAIGSALPDLTPVKFPRVCAKCRAKGIKS